MTFSSAIFLDRDGVLIEDCGLIVDRAQIKLLPGVANALQRLKTAWLVTAPAMLPEAAQGALALQTRAGEAELVARADHAETRRRVEPERRLVAAIGAGCLAPVGAHHDGRLLHALIAAEDGSWVERRSGDDPEALAAELLALAGARDETGAQSAQTRA